MKTKAATCRNCTWEVPVLWRETERSTNMLLTKKKKKRRKIEKKKKKMERKELKEEKKREKRSCMPAFTGRKEKTEENAH